MVVLENGRLLPLVWCVRGTGFVSFLLCLVSFLLVPVCMCIVFEFGVLGVDSMGVLLTSTLPRRGVASCVWGLDCL